VATDVVVPEVGEGGIEVTLARWIAKEGDHVRAGDILFEIDTQKAVLEVEAVTDGVLTGIRVREGEPVDARQVVAVLTRAGDEAIPMSPGAPAAPVPGRPSAPAASPRARLLAAARGIDLTRMRGTGPDGLITERDVDGAISTSADPAARAQDAVARRTLDAWRTIPHFALTLRADVTARIARTRPMTLVAHSLVRALREHPECLLGWEGGRPVRRDRVHLGVLVDTPGGLLLPRVADADEMSVQELESAIGMAVERAKSGRLGSEDGGARSVTISNLGMFSVDSFAGVIASPDVMLLAVSRTSVEPAWREGHWVPRTIVPLTLSIDHRALNGADGARLLTTLERILASSEEAST
jgi:pyruvate dehydrogenase E2 component (dihydrolipoamide acetyltransferase)